MRQEETAWEQEQTLLGSKAPWHFLEDLSSWKALKCPTNPEKFRGKWPIYWYRLLQHNYQDKNKHIGGNHDNHPHLFNDEELTTALYIFVESFRQHIITVSIFKVNLNPKWMTFSVLKYYGVFFKYSFYHFYHFCISVLIFSSSLLIVTTVDQAHKLCRHSQL